MDIIAPNSLKQTIKNGGTAVGTMVAEIRQSAIMQLLANAGFDFVVIDNEHGPFSIESIAELSRTAQYVGLTPIVRVPEITYAHIAQSLDVGAQGIMLPRVRTPQQVEAAIDIMKYPPVGQRGSALGRGLTGFRSGPVVDSLAKLNEETLLIVQIETREAVENLDDIASISGVDALLVGPNDLAISLGVPGQFESEVLKTAIESVIKSCQTHQLCPALHMNDLNLLSSWIQAGMRLVSSGSETSLLTQAGLDLTTTIKNKVTS